MTARTTFPCDEGVLSVGPAEAPCPPDVGRWILAATILGSSMAFIDGTLVNVALPALQAEFDASLTSVQWVVQSYNLFLASLILLGGSLGDALGRRSVFAVGVLLFAAASTWCGLAPSLEQLVIARAVQGVGAALMVPGSLAIIRASFAENERGRAIGTWSAFTAITTAVGPLLGGWLVENISWRAAFFINVPIAAIVLFLTWWRVPESQSARGRSLDLPGAILVTGGLGLLVLGLTEAGSRRLTDPLVLLALGAGVVLLALFILVEARRHAAMMPLQLFRSRDFSGANLLTLFLYAALGGSLFFLPLNLIQVQGYSATAAGAALLPFVILMFLLSRWAGGLVDRYGARRPLTIGPFIVAVGYMLLAETGVDATYWTGFFPGLLILGLGMAVSVAPLTTTVMNAVDEEYVGVASGVNNAVSRLAGLLAIAVMGIVMTNIFNAQLDNSLAALDPGPEVQEIVAAERVKLAGAELPPTIAAPAREEISRAIDEAFVGGFQTIMWLAAVLSVISGFSGWALIRGRA